MYIGIVHIYGYKCINIGLSHLKTTIIIVIYIIIIVIIKNIYKEI